MMECLARAVAMAAVVGVSMGAVTLAILIIDEIGG